MLKKNPCCVDTMKRLRRYVGNTKLWKYTDDQKKIFEAQAQQIREQAEGIYNSFKVINTKKKNSLQYFCGN